nr:MAG TPA: hypothetical protein [Caudoviricetes sp.]
MIRQNNEKYYHFINIEFYTSDGCYENIWL